MKCSIDEVLFDRLRHSIVIITARIMRYYTSKHLDFSKHWNVTRSSIPTDRVTYLKTMKC
ncbi:hypothetical protein HanPSC8_Chr14g0595331 [Helianthus annuus]|nr:hypothetical protein HanPSC8_Chr14g0595331 [Helianthus annuus]